MPVLKRKLSPWFIHLLQIRMAGMQVEEDFLPNQVQAHL